MRSWFQSSAEHMRSRRVGVRAESTARGCWADFFVVDRARRKAAWRPRVVGALPATWHANAVVWGDGVKLLPRHRMAQVFSARLQL